MGEVPKEMEVEDFTKEKEKYEPKPMIKRKSAEKKDNAAERFVKQHSKVNLIICDSDNNINDSTKTNQQRTHNEVEKEKTSVNEKKSNEPEFQRSIIKVIKIKATDLGKNFDRNCKACMQLAILKNLKREGLKPKCKCRVAKPSRNRRHGRKRIGQLKRCKNYTKTYSRCASKRNLRIDSADSLSSNKRERKVNALRKHHPSVSSYSSYASYNHEPMV